MVLTLFLMFFFVLSFVLTGRYRQYALDHHILDFPNARSAHQKPIPRGGGVVFVGLFLGVIVGFFPTQIPLFIGAFGVAVLGYMDDKCPMPALSRIIFHTLFSLGALWALGGMPDLVVAGWHLHFGLCTSAIGVIYLVGILNLYNFMDGINGLAGFEAVCVTLSMVILCMLLNNHQNIVLFLLLAVVVSGFLLWNFPKAKIFMGDAGSGFLGMVLGVWSLQSAGIKPQLFWSWLILLGVFIVDATVTLCRRLLKGEQIHVAHSSHAYQHAAKRFAAHWPVTLGVVAINLLWLFPMAILVGLEMIPGWLGLVVAYCPLIIVACYFKAGCSVS